MLDGKAPEKLFIEKSRRTKLVVQYIIPEGNSQRKP